jgi:Methyltransferase domain
MALEHPQHPNVPFFPAQQLSDFGKYPYTLWDFFPAVYTCPHDIQRVGRLGDGGKWVCGMSLYEKTPAPEVSHPTAGTIIYSFGVNEESTFEAEMLARIPSAQIFAYDFSVTKFGPQLPDIYASRAHFKQVGLGKTDEVNRKPPFFTLSTLMNQNNHSYIDILKIDIEGAEYAAFDAFMDSYEASGATTLPVGQVMIELHLLDDQSVNFERFTNWWERLESFGMRPTWLEVNLLAVTLGKGKTDPRCVEYVWINAKDERSILLQEV